jgi:hypothetical protein
MRKITQFILLILFISKNINAQSLNGDKIALGNFIKRMYNSAPFEGSKVIDDVDSKYFITVLSLEKAKYTNQSTMNRVAQVKAQSQANTFFNGSVVSSEYIIRTSESKSKDGDKSTIETIETIKENASGFVNSIELLNNFEIEEGKRMVFVFYKELEIINDK